MEDGTIWRFVIAFVILVALIGGSVCVFWRNGSSSLLKFVKAGVILVPLCVGVGWLFLNHADVNGFLIRVLTSAKDVAIPGVISVSFGTSKDGTPPSEKWAAFYRVKNKLSLKKVYFSFQDGLEYIDLEALSPIDLTRGYVGDGNELLYLGGADLRGGRNDKRDLFLRTGEGIRVFTFCGPKISNWLIHTPPPVGQSHSHTLNHPPSQGFSHKKVKGVDDVRNTIWNHSCEETLKNIKDPLIGKINKMSLVESINEKVPKIVKEIWKEALVLAKEKKKFKLIRLLEKNYKACTVLYAEFLARKRFWRATNKFNDLKVKIDHDVLKIDMVAEKEENNQEEKKKSTTKNDTKIFDQVKLNVGKDEVYNEFLGKGGNDNYRGCLADLEKHKSLIKKKRNPFPSMKYVLARCISTNPEKGEGDQIECLTGLPRFRGLFKANQGQGDRIVVMGEDKSVLLDLDYWWGTSPWTAK